MLFASSTVVWRWYIELWKNHYKYDNFFCSVPHFAIKPRMLFHILSDFQFEINTEGGRDSELPRLMFTANNTQFDFVLDKYTPKFNRSRFALEMSVIANYSSKPMEMDETHSIDDEYSPGVFRVSLMYYCIFICLCNVPYFIHLFNTCFCFFWLKMVGCCVNDWLSN